VPVVPDPAPVEPGMRTVAGHVGVGVPIRIRRSLRRLGGDPSPVAQLWEAIALR